MLFAKRVFFWSAVYGIVVLTPLYFIESRLNELFPPPITHPEHYYGFVGVTLTWHLAFILISRDPARFRPMMVPAVLEKFSFGMAAWVLLMLGRVSPPTVAAGTFDLVLGVLFVLAFFKTGPAVRDAPATG
jgi:hypothetical protein